MHAKPSTSLAFLFYFSILAIRHYFDAFLRSILAFLLHFKGGENVGEKLCFSGTFHILLGIITKRFFFPLQDKPS